MHPACNIARHRSLAQQLLILGVVFSKVAPFRYKLDCNIPSNNNYKHHKPIFSRFKPTEVWGEKQDPESQTHTHQQHSRSMASTVCLQGAVSLGITPANSPQLKTCSLNQARIAFTRDFLWTWFWIGRTCFETFCPSNFSSWTSGSGNGPRVKLQATF
jgi:hypothetical protein